MPRWTQRPFVEEVPQLLAQQGMSLRALAAAVEVNPSHLSRVLRRRDYQRPSGELARRVALAFDLPEDYFPEYRESVVVVRVRSDPGLRDRLYRRYAASDR